MWFEGMDYIDKLDGDSKPNEKDSNDSKNESTEE